MSNRHYKVDEEIEVTIKVKVSSLQIDTYQQLNEVQQAEHVTDFKQSISEHLKEKLNASYNQQEVTFGVDWWSFEVE